MLSFKSLEKVYRVPPTRDTPFFLIEPKNNIIEIVGRSVTNKKFWLELSKNVDKYLDLRENTTPLQISCIIEYFNTPSLKQLVELFRLIEKKVPSEQSILKWHVQKDDEDFIELGEDLASILSFKFEFVIFSEAEWEAELVRIKKIK